MDKCKLSPIIVLRRNGREDQLCGEGQLAAPKIHNTTEQEEKFISSYRHTFDSIVYNGPELSRASRIIITATKSVKWWSALECGEEQRILLSVKQFPETGSPNQVWDLGRPRPSSRAKRSRFVLKFRRFQLPDSSKFLEPREQWRDVAIPIRVLKPIVAAWKS